jgi:hypothetical protein
MISAQRTVIIIGGVLPAQGPETIQEQSGEQTQTPIRFPLLASL